MVLKLYTLHEKGNFLLFSRGQTSLARYVCDSVQIMANFLLLVVLSDLANDPFYHTVDELFVEMDRIKLCKKR